MHLGDPSGRDALAKLGATGVGDARPLASLDPPPALVPLFDAVRIRASVRFRHRGSDRTMIAGGPVVPPRSLVRRWGGTPTATRRGASGSTASRGCPSVGAEGSGSLPEGFDPSAFVPDEPWLTGG